MSIILQTVIAIIAIIAMFSIINSVILEAIRRLTKKRAIDLQKAIMELLSDPYVPANTKSISRSAASLKLISNDQLTQSRNLKGMPGEALAQQNMSLGQQILEHPFIVKLREAEGGKQLSWIPSDVFAETFIHLLVKNGSKMKDGEGQSDEEPVEIEEVLNSFLAGIKILPASIQPAVIQLFRYVKDQKGDELSTLKNKVAGFYDSYMNRVTALFKKKSKVLLFIIGLVMAGVWNIDLIKITNTLLENEDLRVEYYNLGKDLSQHEIKIDTDRVITYLTQNLRGINGNELLSVVASNISVEGDSTVAFVAGKSQLPIGWTDTKATLTKGFSGAMGEQILWKILGILLMAAALAMGSPFWFDLLKKATQVDKVLEIKT